MNKKIIMINKVFWITAVYLLTLTVGKAFAMPIEYDLTTGADISHTIKNAIFSNPSTLSNVISGTGTFGTFVQIQNNPIEQGYNTSKRDGFPTNPPDDTNAKTNFDTNNADTHNHDIQLGDVLIIEENNILYRQFLLDINEGNDSKDNFLSMDMFQLYISDTAGNFIQNDDESVLGSDNALGKIVYDMDSTTDSRILLNYDAIGSGSGRPDLQVLVPNDLFLSFDDTSYLYLFSRFGDKGCVDVNGDPVARNSNSNQCVRDFSGDFGANAGFEEWANLLNGSDFCKLNSNDPRCPPPGPGPGVPEPNIVALIGMGLLGMGMTHFRKKRKNS